MRVLLVNPVDNMARIIGSSSYIARTPAWGLMYLATYLRRAGVDVRLFDAYLLGATEADIIEEIRTCRPDLVGFSVLVCNGNDVYRLTREIRGRFPGLKIVLGNIHAAVFADFYLRENCADYVCHGEGELTMAELCRLFGERDLSRVAGLSWRRADGAVVHNRARQPIADLDELPFLDYDLVDMDRISLPFYIQDIKRAYVAFTSRGCPNRCTFCAVHNRQYRWRSVNNVVDEYEQLVRVRQAQFVQFGDPLFMGNQQRTLDICREIVRRRLNVIPWNSEAHVNFVSPEMLAAMRDSGCDSLCFGIESGNQELLDRINKRITLERIEAAVKMTRAHGIKVQGLFMLGLPGETRAKTLKTIEFAKRLPLDFAQFSITTPYPGTELYDTLLRDGKLDLSPGGVNPADWERFSAYISFTKMKPVWVTEGMNYEELLALQKQALRSFYFRPRQIVKELRKFRMKHIGNYLQALRTLFCR